MCIRDRYYTVHVGLNTYVVHNATLSLRLQKIILEVRERYKCKEETKENLDTKEQTNTEDT